LQGAPAQLKVDAGRNKKGMRTPGLRPSRKRTGKAEACEAWFCRSSIIQTLDEKRTGETILAGNGSQAGGGIYFDILPRVIEVQDCLPLTQLAWKTDGRKFKEAFSTAGGATPIVTSGASYAKQIAILAGGS
jgi:hypothetical protein